ncbi:MAG: pyridoxal phosphate-dependent aminotransferase family protein [Clostridiales bacterium]|nr:pyridoxal phosphate-dependent aminotransferase family protein [Clostridiales bacterium]
MDLFKKCRDYTLVKEFKENGLYPYFRELETKQDVEVIMDGKRRIMLGSNNYLGLTTHPDVVQAGLDALSNYGSGCSGSRFLNGTLKLHTELETKLAKFIGKEAVTTFSTGFMSNLGIISAITSKNDYILSDRENHASIYDGCKLSWAKMLRYKHSDMEDLERLLKTVPDTAGILIVTDGVFSMGGDVAKLPEIVALAKKYGARVMVDDAHGLGVLGEKGRGTAEYFGLTDQVDIIMGTFSKSLASIGGYMAADREVVEYVRHTSRPFIFCASIPPASCATAIAALDVLDKNPSLVKRLSSLSQYVRDGLTARNIKIRKSDAPIPTPIVPIYTYDTVTTLKMSKLLYEAGIYVNSVLAPATPPTECLLRTSYMATHTTELLDEAMDVIKEVFDKHFVDGNE